MGRVLIVDDEIENLKMLKLALQDENPDWEIDTCSNKDTCLEKLTEGVTTGAPVDLVLTDLVIDDEATGMRIIKEARKIDPLVMSILFTAKEKSLDRYAAFDYGAFDVVEKNIRGSAAFTEINIKSRAAVQYRNWSRQVNFLQKYFDPKLFSAITSEPELLTMSSRTVTIVFWDIRGFSRLCEALKGHPMLISGFLTEYCEIAAKCIFNNDGVLDKFIGDGVMALFGALAHGNTDKSCGVFGAIAAALEFRTEFEALLDKWRDEWALYVPDAIDIGIGCGIHTGDALVGNVGTKIRDQFTALGPHVNFAARIEGRSNSSQILLSQTAQARAKPTYKLLEVDEISDIKNIPGKFKIFELSG